MFKNETKEEVSDGGSNKLSVEHDRSDKGRRGGIREKVQESISEERAETFCSISKTRNSKDRMG